MRHGSFSAVAKILNSDPATISRQIKSLESHLQVRLFQRTTRHMEPTEAARVYYCQIEPLLEGFSRAKSLATETRHAVKGRLRLASPVSFAQLNLVPLLPLFSAEYPDIHYELLLNDEDLDLVDHQLDLAIRVGAVADSRLIGVKLCDMNARVCATPAYLQQYGMPDSPSALGTHDCLVLAYRDFSAEQWHFTERSTGQRQTIAPKIKLKTSNAMALKQCALAHMGITLQARWMVGKELNTGGLVDLFPDHHVTAAASETAAWLLYPERTYQPYKVRCFINFLKQSFAKGSPWSQA